MDREELLAQLAQARQTVHELRTAEDVDVEALTRAIAVANGIETELSALDAAAAPARIAGTRTVEPQTQRLADALRERGLNDDRNVDITFQRDIWTGTEYGPNETGEALDIVVPEYDAQIDRRPREGTTFLDIVPTRPISSDTLIYYKQTGFTNNAGPKARRVDGGNSTDTFGAYSESSITTEKVTVSVVSIGHTVVTDEISLEDSDQLESLVVDEGVFGVRENIEAQLLAASDTPNGLQSVAVTGPGRAQTVSYDAVDGDENATALNFILAIRQAKRDARKAGLPADFVVLTPDQAYLLDVARNDSGNFYKGGPFSDAGDRIWGLTIIESTRLHEGAKALVGSTRKLQLLARRGITVRKGYTGNQFSQDAVTLKVSGRFAVKNVRPEAFVVITENPDEGGDGGVVG